LYGGKEKLRQIPSKKNIISWIFFLQNNDFAKGYPN